LTAKTSYVLASGGLAQKDYDMPLQEYEDDTKDYDTTN
jgi:hypothetical protein